MPTVPNLDVPSVQAEAIPGRANPRIDTDVTPADFGAGLAHGLDAVGQAGSEQTAKDNAKAAAVEAQLKSQNDQLRVVDANTQLEAGKTAFLYGKSNPDGTRTGGAFSLHGTDAMNMPDKILPQYDQLSQSISATLTPDQQKLFAAHILLGKNELNTSLNRYEYEESNRLASSIYSNGAKQTIENASTGWRDPQNLVKAKLDMVGLVQMQGDREGWSPEQRADELQKNLAEMHFNVVDRQLADGKPQAALAYFKQIRDSNELTGQQAHQLGAQIDAAMSQGKAQNQTGLLTQMRDASTAAMNGLAVPPSSMPSKAAVLAAFPEDGERRYQALQSDIQMGATIKGMSGMSMTDLQSTVDAAKPTQVEGATDQFEHYQVMQQAAQRVVAQRNADPRQAVIDNKLGSNALNFGDMQATTSEIKTRIATLQADSVRFGSVVPLLSKNETAQFAQRLATMDPGSRQKTLAALNQGLSDDRGFQTLMHQILPSSPVTAIVGSQLNQSSPNNTPVWMDRRFDRDPNEAIRTLAGESLLNPALAGQNGKETKFKLPPEESQGANGQPGGLRNDFNTYAGAAMAGRPDLAEATYATFRANYAQRLAEAGNYSGAPSADDPKIRDAALRATVGNVTQYNKGSVIVPPGLDPSRFGSVVEAAVAARARAVGLDPSQLRGYQLAEVGAVGSGRYQLLNGNAPIVNPGGKVLPGDPRNAAGEGLFQIDIRNQYMPDRSQPTAADARRQAEQGAPAAPTPVPDIGGTPTKVPERLETEKVIKAPGVTGLARGGGKGGRAHPSQGDVETE